MLYQQVILDNAKLRYGSGHPQGTTSHQINPTCGDEVTLGVRLTEDGELSEVAWEGDGCSISQASLSILCQLIEGKTRAEIEQLFSAFESMMHSQGKDLSEDDLDLLLDAAAFSGTAKFVNRIKCALLGWMALKDALAKADAEQVGRSQQTLTHEYCEEK